MVSPKATENRLRRMAERQGLQVVKSRRRDPLAKGFGTYALHDEAGTIIAGPGLTTEQLEQALRGKGR